VFRRLGVVLSREAQLMLPALLKGFARLDVDGLPTSDFFLFALGQVQGQRPGDLPDDGILTAKISATLPS
jgi:hypothetical protein